MPSEDGPDLRRILVERQQRGYRPGAEDDGYRIGLAVEGGGMRGVVSGAMLIALGDLGFADCFDGLYATSSGAMNVAYFLAGNGWRGMSMYYDHLVDSDFVSFARVLRGRRLVRIDTVMEIMDGQLSIDMECVTQRLNRLRYAFALSRVDEPGFVDVSSIRSGSYLRQVLRAGAWLPVLAGTPQTVLDPAGVTGTYVDGGVYTPAPFYLGIRDGCSHVLQLTSRTISLPRPTLSLADRMLAARMNRWRTGAGDLYKASALRHLRVLARLGYGDSEINGTIVRRLACQPQAHQVTRLTSDRWTLLSGARAAYRTVSDYLRLPGDTGDGTIYLSCTLGAES